MSPRLDPEAEALLEVMSAAGTAPLHTLTVEQARQQMRAAFITKGESIALHHVEDASVPTPHGGLAVRLYRPAAGVLPMALFIHGGGWTLNDLDTHDRLCRRIAQRSGWLLASLDYRRAPEHTHPAALEDAHIAYRWLLDNAERVKGDSSRLALVGESSGGTIAACLTLLLRDLGAPMPGLQILAYPLTDRYDRWPSYRERGTGYMLDNASLRWFLDNYIPAGHDLEDPYLFPLAARDLGGLARTFVITAEFDPLRDEGVAYAERLAAAGVVVEHLHAEDQMHGFLLLDRAIAKAGVLIDRLADALADQASVGSAGATRIVCGAPHPQTDHLNPPSIES
ncbi:MAG: alpha/beta hydrolase [Solirubrobacteraceae bacterium]|jgi:acetyl esterase